MTPIFAILGILLVIVAIPLGLMLAPLVLGAILISIGIRRADRALNAPFGGASA